MRLGSGETLVTHDDGVHLVARDLSVAEMKVQHPTDDNASYGAKEPLRIGKAVWLRINEFGLTLYRPVKAARFVAHIPESREKKQARTRTAPAAVTADGGDASAGGPAEMPAPVGFSTACTTPFVILATPPHVNGSYPATSKGLAGQFALASKLSFVEFKRGKVVYFGAQARDEASARKLMEIVSAKIPGMKPQLGCLDALKHIADRYNPPKNMRVVFLHLGSGVQLRLDR